MPIEQVGEWYFTARLVRGSDCLGKWCGWCAKIPELGDSALDIDPKLETHVEFAETFDEVIAKLKREVLQ